MKKILIVLAALTIISCHTSPYVFNIPNILAMDGRKLPEMLGKPFEETAPSAQELNDNADVATGRSIYAKKGYSLSVYYYYKTGIIKSLDADKLISQDDIPNTDMIKEKSDFVSKLNLNNISLPNYEVSQVSMSTEKATKQTFLDIRVHIHIK